MGSEYVLGIIGAGAMGEAFVRRVVGVGAAAAA